MPPLPQQPANCRRLLPRFTLRTLFGVMTCLAIYLSVARATDFVRATLFIGGLLELCYAIRSARRRSFRKTHVLRAIVGLALIWVASIEWYGEQQRCVRCDDLKYVSGYRCLGIWISRTEISLDPDPPKHRRICQHRYREVYQWHSWWGLVIPVHSEHADLILTLDSQQGDFGGWPWAGGPIRAGWPRVIAHPALPQIRTCRFPASGSSRDPFASHTVGRVDYQGKVVGGLVSTAEMVRLHAPYGLVRRRAPITNSSPTAPTGTSTTPKATGRFVTYGPTPTPTAKSTRASARRSPSTSGTTATGWSL